MDYKNQLQFSYTFNPSLDQDYDKQFPNHLNLSLTYVQMKFINLSNHLWTDFSHFCYFNFASSYLLSQNDVIWNDHAEKYDLREGDAEIVDLPYFVSFYFEYSH